MDDTSDSLSEAESLGCLDQAFSLSDSVYDLFEHSVSTIVTADTVAETPSPQVGRRRRHHSRAEENVQAAAVRLSTPVPPLGDGRRERSKRRVCLQAAVQPPSPRLSPRRSKRRKVSSSPRQKEENSARTPGFVPASSLRNSFLNVWLDPCQPSTSSSSSCSISSSLFSTHGSAASASEGEDVSVDTKVEIDPYSPAGAAAGQSHRDRRSATDVGSLSFLTTEERAWLSADTTAVEQSAPPPPEEIIITSDDDDDEAVVRIAQCEEDEVMARRMQEQFDREQAEPPPSSRSHHHHHQHLHHLHHHHNHMEQFYRDPREAQSSRSHQHHQHDHSHMFGMLSSTVWTPPWLEAVQMAALGPFYGENDAMAGQRRGSGSRRGSRQRRAPPQLYDGSPGNDYEALLAFEERQGTVVAKKTLSKSEINRFPTKKYDSAQTAANTRCQICFCDYTCGEELRMLSCFHDYHVECIDKWLKVNATCPVCRCNMALDGQA